MQINEVKRRAKAGELQVGTWIHTLGSIQVPQILATAGFDYVHIDMEHSSLSIETVGELCLAAKGAGIVPVVRPPGLRPDLISRPLDNGAMGILQPHVDTRADAEAVVRAAKFPPLGMRGSQPPSAHTDFGPTNTVDYMALSNDEQLIMVQIESEQAVENLDEILSTPGVDGCSLGRGDLSADLGIAGQRDHPRILAALETMIDACQRHGAIPGLMVQQVEDAHRWIDRGIRYLTYTGETSILRRAAEEAIRQIRRADKPVS